MSVAVVSSTCQKLMPTSAYRARCLLKQKCAIIYKYRPIFTIQLVERGTGDVQPIEYASDTGKYHVGVSIQSEKHEYVSATYNMLHDEKQRHDACRKYRRTRRNHLRYRKPRFDNRSKQNKQMAPSIRHIEENQLRLFDSYYAVMPIATATFEMGQFDTQLLEAMKSGKPLPHGTDYQRGYRYQMETGRKAVFARDGYKCQLCGRSIEDGAILCVHHIGMHKDHSNRMSNLITLCTKCHTAKNHQPGGKLYNWHPKVRSMAGAAYMNQVRWDLYHKLVINYPSVDIHIQYGAKTAETRHNLHLMKDKSDLANHAIDAYCIGIFHPLHRAHTIVVQKKRRNNRILSKFYDAKYIDVRDGRKKSGASLSCGRTNRKEPRNSDKNERIYRGKKCSKGRVAVRKQHYTYQPGDTVQYNNVAYIVKGTHCNGTRVILDNNKSVNIHSLVSLRKEGGWHLLHA